MAIPDFSFLQYNTHINWPNQENTSINVLLNNYIIIQIIGKKEDEEVSVYDIGFGTALLFRMLEAELPERFKTIILEGCEPSTKNFRHSASRLFRRKGLSVKTSDRPFHEIIVDKAFDFVTAIYVFPHFRTDHLHQIAAKIRSMLKKSGRFILAVANEQYLERKLHTNPVLIIRQGTFSYEGVAYKEVIHYSDIPKIGSIVDCNREEKFYMHLFANNDLVLDHKTLIDDKGFICRLFVFAAGV